MFIYEAVADELTSISSLDSLVNSYCSQGGNILYHRNSVGGHNQELFCGRPRVLDYLSTIFDDTGAISIPKTGCQTKNVTKVCDVTLVSTTAVEGSRTVPYKAITVTERRADVLSDGVVVDADTLAPLDFAEIEKQWESSLNTFQSSAGGSVSPLDTYGLSTKGFDLQVVE
jgi:hypothetical protein